MKTNLLKNRIALLVIIASVATNLLPIQAYADSKLNRYGSTVSEYQAILDKANEEYGTEFMLITQEHVDWAHARMVEQLGYLPDGGPRVTTLEDLQAFTLSEFDVYVRGECAREAAYIQESERLQEQYEQGFYGADDTLSIEDSPSSRVSLFYYNGFPYTEHAVLWAIKAEGTVMRNHIG